jgi:hypothetical protein
MAILSLFSSVLAADFMIFYYLQREFMGEVSEFLRGERGGTKGDTEKEPPGGELDDHISDRLLTVAFHSPSGLAQRAPLFCFRISIDSRTITEQFRW